mmetsp:Transcript_64915/g.135355  ORF Transcript_64915/g.135355 Transcript_64915/m.135355 type:complete len:222 (+) Transcript_64915:6862-7527(+)
MSDSTARSWSTTVESASIVITWYVPLGPDSPRTRTPRSVKLIVSPGLISRPWPGRDNETVVPSPRACMPSSSCVPSPSTRSVTSWPWCISPLLRSTNETSTTSPTGTARTNCSDSSPIWLSHTPEDPNQAADGPVRFRAGSLGLCRLVQVLGGCTELARLGHESVSPVRFTWMPAASQALLWNLSVMVDSAPMMVVLADTVRSMKPGISLASITFPLIALG